MLTRKTSTASLPSSPRALSHMFSRLPILQGFFMNLGRNGVISNRDGRVHVSTLNTRPDQQPAVRLLILILKLASSKLSRLVLFENFNEKYLESFTDEGLLNDVVEPVRTPSSAVGRVASNPSHLGSLSASFVVDAVNFSDIDKALKKWPNLTSLILTSQLPPPDQSRRRLQICSE